MALRRWVGRAIGLDVHRDFCVVAICEDGKVRSAGRVPSTPAGLELLAESLLPTDRVALEVTASCWEVARILEPFVERVVVVSPDDTGISSARAKTDKLDARTLAVLLWRGELEAVWVPDERCRVLRRRLARREQLVHARSRSKNEISAVLQRRLIERPLFAVLDRGGGDHHHQQQPDRVNHDVALAAIDLLARVIPACRCGDGVRALHRLRVQDPADGSGLRLSRLVRTWSRVGTTSSRFPMRCASRFAMRCARNY